MNVIRTENAKVRPVTRGRGRARGRDQRINRTHGEEPIINSKCFPKYEFSASARRPLMNGIQSSSSARTPSHSRRYPGIPSSSSARMRSSTFSSANLHAATSTSTSAIDSTVIMAITSGRGDARCEVGMAAIDVKFPHLIISQMSDSQTYVNTLMKIHLFNPVEIIMPETMCAENDPRKKLFNTIKSKFEHIHIIPISRIHFNEENGLDRIKTHCANEFSTIELFVKEKYYALSTTAALLRYVEYIQHIIYEPNSLKIEFQASQGATLIDVESAMSLELVSSYGPQRNYSLFLSLDRCVTPMGRRFLRSQILQPPCDNVVIKNRQACVSELVRNRNLHTILQPIAKQLFGADRLLGLSMRAMFVSECVETAERNLNYILLLKTSLEIIPQLSSALDPATSPNLVKIRENLKDPRFRKMKDRILEIVQSDARSVNGYTSSNMQRCFALKSGINDMLDVARQTYCELIDQTRILVESLAQEHRLPLELACSASLEYHIRMDIPKRSNFNINELPNVFMEVQKKKNCLYMTTDLLMTLSQQCKDARDELHIMSNCILETLITVLREDVGCLFQLSEDIAELDLVMSLARISAIPDYVKPTFGESLRVINSKHPIIDIFGTELPRPNNVEASIPYNFHNITGPNMSGKTTYLKQVVLLNIMAQIGCYLPATAAKIRIADRIFCRLCPSHEDIESNASAFIQEIKEIEYIVQFVTPRSLIVLDEICRSTNVEEGSTIAFAICEKLLQTTAFIFNCTHFLYLTKLTELYHNVVNHYFECVPNELDKWGLKYTHKLRSGVTDVENYGISAASAARMPKPVIERAKRLVEEISVEIKPLPFARAPELSWEKDCYACVAKIMELMITQQYTSENVQLAIKPLRAKKNFNLSQKESNPVTSRIIQSNLQGNMTGNQETPNVLQAKTALNHQNNPGSSKVVQFNPEISTYMEGAVISNPIRSNDGAFKAYDINASSNILQNTIGTFSDRQRCIESLDLQSNNGALNVRQINIMGHNDLQSNDVLRNGEQIGFLAANPLKHSESKLQKCTHQSYFQESVYQSQFQDSGHQSNFQLSKNQFNLQQSDPQKSGHHQMELIPLNNLYLYKCQVEKLDQFPSPKSNHQFQLHQLNQSETSENPNYGTFLQQKNVSQESDRKSPFKIPIPIRPTSSYHVNMEKVKRTREESGSPTGTDISNFEFFKKGKSPSISSGLRKLRPLNMSLSGLETSTSGKFSFSNENVDSDKRSLNLQDFQISDTQDEGKSLISQNSNLSNLSFTKERNSNISLNSKISKRSWQPDPDTTKLESQTFSCSHISASRDSLQREMDSRSILSKRSKLDSKTESNEVSLNSIAEKNQETLSSFNTANLSFSLGLNSPCSPNQMSIAFVNSSQGKEKSPSFCQSQKISEIQDVCRTPEKPATQKSEAPSYLRFLYKKEESKDFIKKNQKTEEISSPKYSISDFESLMDEDSEDSDELDDVSETFTLNLEPENTIVTVSSVNTAEAAESARKKEDEIFNQIENVKDEGRFFQKLFNSPLSVEFSEELCSCSYESTPKK